MQKILTRFARDTYPAVGGLILLIGILCIVQGTLFTGRAEAKIKVKEGLVYIELKDAELSSVLKTFAAETGVNIVAGKNLVGTVTVFLKNVTPEQALEAILEVNNYTYVREGDILVVVPLLETEVEVELADPGAKYSTRAFEVNYINVDDLKPTLETLLPAGTRILTTKGSRSIVVEGTPRAVRKAARIIGKLDARPKQVMVESKILEVSWTGKSSLGVNLKWTNPDNPSEVVQTKGLAFSPSASGAEGLYWNVTTADTEILLDALSSKTGFDLLSSPKVIATDGQEAEIITGAKYGYKVKTITTTGLIESVEFLDVGTKLVFTASIKNDNYILMDIHPEVSEGSVVEGLPQKKSTEATTQILVKDGQTIIIGGLLKDKAQQINKGIPILSEIPILGIPFRRMEIESEKKEIIVLITPHIIRPQVIEAMEGSIKEMEKKHEEFEPSIFW